VLERIRFALICRRCASAPCVAACPRGALEKVPSGTNDAGMLKRANMLCTGCGTCALACPFGTIYDDLLPVCPAASVTFARTGWGPRKNPCALSTCEDGSIDYQKVQPAGRPGGNRENLVIKVADGDTWKPFLRDKQEAGNDRGTDRT